MNKRIIILLPLLLAVGLFVPSTVLRSAQAQLTGLVCITATSTATSCPASPPSINAPAVGQNLTIGVFIQNSDAMGGFDIYVRDDQTFLNPRSAALGPLIATPTSTIVCINGLSVVGACTVNSANGPGVVEVSTLESAGSNECGGISPCSGMAFSITYTVVSSPTSTPLDYPTHPACGTSSVANPPNVCVLVSDAFGTTLSENIQTATVAGAAPPTLVSVVNGIDGNLYWSPFTGSWNTWQPLNGQSPSPPTLCASSPSSTELVVRGTDNQVYHKTFSGSSFAATWDNSPGGVTIDQPACAVLGTTLYVVVRGATGEIWATTFNLSTHTWAAAWTDLLGFSPSAPALAATSSLNRLDLVVRGTDDQIYHKAFTSGAWAASWDTSNRTPIPDKTVTTPAILSDGSNLHVVVVGEDYSLYYVTRSLASGTWSTYTNLVGSSPTTPSLLVDPAGTLHLVVLGFDQHVYAKAKPSAGAFDAAWSNAGGITKNRPAAVMLGSNVAVVATGFDSRLWYNTQTSGTWSGWVNMNGAAAQSPGLSTP